MRVFYQICKCKAVYVWEKWTIVICKLSNCNPNFATITSYNHLGVVAGAGLGSPVYPIVWCSCSGCSAADLLHEGLHCSRGFISLVGCKLLIQENWWTRTIIMPFTISDKDALLRQKSKCFDGLVFWWLLSILSSLDYLQVAIEIIFIHIHVYHGMTHPNLTIILLAIIYAEERGAFHIFHETDVWKSVSMSKSYNTFRIQGLSQYQKFTFKSICGLKLRLPAP